jgi:hypothetical protein
MLGLYNDGSNVVEDVVGEEEGTSHSVCTLAKLAAALWQTFCLIV